MTDNRAYQGRGPSSLAGGLLAYAATGAPLDGGDSAFAWRPEGSDLRQFQWVLDGGLGPLLQRAARGCIDLVPPAWRDALSSADLTARIRHADRVETMLEIIDACDAQHVPVILLKGISVSEQLYPAEHLRPMADIDVMVPREVYAAIERALLDHGYHRLDRYDLPGHHHGAPLCHPRLHTIVELHTGLFTDNSPLSEASAFNPSRVAGQSIASRYHGRLVRRLTPEVQLAYIASSWFNDIADRKAHPTFLASAFDAVYLLAASGPTLNWGALLDWLDNEMAKASLHAMVTYLPRYGVEPPPRAALARLASSQTLVGPIQLRLIHGMLDRHLFGGWPWNHALPPPVPGRYSIRRQFRKRVLSRLRRRA